MIVLQQAAGGAEGGHTCWAQGSSLTTLRLTGAVAAAPAAAAPAVMLWQAADRRARLLADDADNWHAGSCTMASSP